jgi:hypothetical protein
MQEEEGYMFRLKWLAIIGPNYNDVHGRNATLLDVNNYTK